ncbi:hypothetical protein V1477_015454, partial [Vespula maculifrons]
MPDRRRLASCPQGFWWGDLKNAVLDGSPNRYHANVDTLRGVFSNVKLPIDLLRVCFVRCCYKIDPYGYVEACRMYQQDLTYFKGSPPWYFGCVGCKDFAGYNRRLSEVNIFIKNILIRGTLFFNDRYPSFGVHVARVFFRANRWNCAQVASAFQGGGGREEEEEEENKGREKGVD